MKKFLLILSGTLLIAGTVEARGYEHHNRRSDHRPRYHHFSPHPEPYHKEVIIVSNLEHSHGCGCNAHHTKYINHYIKSYPAASNIYFHNRNFGIGFSNLWW